MRLELGYFGGSHTESVTGSSPRDNQNAPSVSAHRLTGRETEGVDEPAEAEVAHHRPTELHDLFLSVELEQLIEKRLIDVVVVDEEAFGVMQRGLLSGAEVLRVPRANLRDRFLFEGLSFP